MDGFDAALLGIELLAAVVVCALMYALRFKPFMEFKSLIWVPRSSVREGLGGLSEQDLEVEQIKRITGSAEEQESEQNLGAGQHHADLVQELDELAVDALLPVLGHVSSARTGICVAGSGSHSRLPGFGAHADPSDRPRAPRLCTGAGDLKRGAVRVGRARSGRHLPTLPDVY